MKPASLLVVLPLVLALAFPAKAEDPATAVLEGTVLEAASGLPPVEAKVQLFYGPFQLPVRETLVRRETGAAFRIDNLPPGRYYLAVLADGLTTQWWDHVNCPIESFCFSRLTPIELTVGQVRTGFDFSLSGLGTISGQVRDELTGQGIADAQIIVSAFGSAGVRLVETVTDANGFYTATGVPSLAAVVRASRSGYRTEYYEDVPYDSPDSIYSARPIPVSPGETTSGIDITLVGVGRITARLVAAESGAPITDGCQVTVLRQGVPRPSGIPVYNCDNEGRVNIDGLSPGFYYLAALPSATRAAFLYGKGTCNGERGGAWCNLDGATAIEVRSNQESGPFELPVEKSVAITGRVEFSEAFGVVPVADIRVYDQNGNLATRGSVLGGFHQDYQLTGLAPGRYYLVFDGQGRWQNVAWQGVACNRWYCDPLRGTPIDLAAGEQTSKNVTLFALAPYEGCTPSETALCLNQGRYQVKATWRDFGGASGAGIARMLTGETGYFYFFSPDNLEVVIKALNGCDPTLGHHFWIYAAGLTNVQVQLEVKDTLTGELKLYSNALGTTFQPILDSAAFATCDASPTLAEATTASVEALAARPGEVWPESSEVLNAADPLELCSQDDPFRLCLGGRFRLTAKWTLPGGQTQHASAKRITADTGTFTFFNPDNVEIVVKVLDACTQPTPGHWVFASGLTDVKVELEVKDLATGRAKTYLSDFGPFAPIVDFASFPCQ